MRTVFLAQGSDQRVASLLPNSTTSITHALVETLGIVLRHGHPTDGVKPNNHYIAKPDAAKKKPPAGSDRAGFGLQRSRSAATLVGSYLIKPPLHPAINSLASMVPSLSVSNVVKSNV